MASSTSLGFVPKGRRLQDISNDELAQLLKLSRKEVPARRALLSRQQTDPAWVAATLDALPAATLALLSLLVEAGGLMLEHELACAAREDFGMSANDCRVAVDPAIASMLVVPLRVRGDEIAFAVVLPAGTLIAPLVANLELCELATAAFVASESPAQNARTFLAACLALRHFDLKLTHEGRPHRGAIKRLAKQGGLDEASLEAMLVTGLDLGMVSLEGELMRPDTVALAGAAIGRYPGVPALAELQALLAGGPVASAALVRSLRRRAEREHVSLLGGDALAYLPGFEVGTVDGVAAVTRGTLEGVASGHVMPSFEVFLAPESRLLDVVHVGACCEWVRVDRAIVARITKPSIARAVAGGSSAGQILEQLAAASRHPIPQNVEAAIRDWAGSVVSAAIATGHVIVVDTSARARVAPVLAKFAARELAPGVFVAGGDEDLREITLALTRAGIYHREVPPVRPLASCAPEPEPPSPPPGAARIRTRVAAWRRGEPFEGVRDDFLDKYRVAEATPIVKATHVAQATQAIHAAQVTTSATRTSSELFERWALKHDCRLDDDEPSRDGILSLLTMLSAGEAASILDNSRDVGQLLRALSKVMVKPGLLWQRADLREHLQVAARRSEVLALQLARDTRYIEITQMMRRGTVWMVLGEDIVSGAAVALRLDDIQAIAALPDDFDFGSFDDDDDDGDDGGDGPLDRKPWRPAQGEAPPAGHLPCPCGSGVRYRHCCRDTATA